MTAAVYHCLWLGFIFRQPFSHLCFVGSYFLFSICYLTELFAFILLLCSSVSLINKIMNTFHAALWSTHSDESRYTRTHHSNTETLLFTYLITIFWKENYFTHIVINSRSYFISLWKHWTLTLSPCLHQSNSLKSMRESEQVHTWLRRVEFWIAALEHLPFRFLKQFSETKGFGTVCTTPFNTTQEERVTLSICE